MALQRVPNIPQILAKQKMYLKYLSFEGLKWHNILLSSVWWEANNWLGAWLAKCVPCNWAWRRRTFIGNFHSLSLSG